jgi:hypothetical protein
MVANTQVAQFFIKAWKCQSSIILNGWLFSTNHNVHRALERKLSTSNVKHMVTSLTKSPLWCGQHLNTLACPCAWHQMMWKDCLTVKAEIDKPSSVSRCRGNRAKGRGEVPMASASTMGDLMMELPTMAVPCVSWQDEVWEWDSTQLNGWALIQPMSVPIKTGGVVCWSWVCRDTMSTIVGILVNFKSNVIGYRWSRI